MTHISMRQKYCTIYIVRHGETEWNLQHRFQGQKDSPLTALGFSQAKTLAQSLKNIAFDAIFSSDLLRAKRTAKIIALERKLAVKTTKLLREHNYGVLEGKRVDEVRGELHSAFDEYERLSDEEKFRFTLIPNGESDEQIVARFITFIREVAVSFAGKRIMVVTHGGLMSAFFVHIGFGRQDKVRIANTGYFVMESDGIDFFIKETHGVNLQEGHI